MAARLQGATATAESDNCTFLRLRVKSQSHPLSLHLTHVKTASDPDRDPIRRSGFRDEFRQWSEAGLLRERLKVSRPASFDRIS
jgi:hypothetical protein